MNTAKAAKIARLVHSDHQPPKNPYAALKEARRKRCRYAARSILWELTQPTDEQLTAAERTLRRIQAHGRPLGALDCADIYREMIRAIIPPIDWKD